MWVTLTINGPLGANGFLQIGRNCVDTLSEIWGRTPELVPKISYRLKCKRGQEGLMLRRVSEKTLERRWPLLLSEDTPYNGMVIILQHPKERDTAILNVKAGDLSKLAIKYFDPSGKVDGSHAKYSTVLLDELTKTALGEPRLF